MFVLGLILILLAALLVLAAVMGGADDAASFDIGSLELTGLNVAVVFLTGALTLLVLVMGLGFLRVAARRSRARRQEAKELQKVSAKLEQREAELRQERGEHPAPASGTTHAGDDIATRPAPPPPLDTTREGSGTGSGHPQDPSTRSS
jgi:membrane protein implicated in regulation of membrane protease activity